MHYADVTISMVWRYGENKDIDRSSYQHHLQLLSEQYLLVEENKWVHIIDSDSVSIITSSNQLNTQSPYSQRAPNNERSPDNILQCLHSFYESEEVSSNYTGLYYAWEATKAWWLNKWTLVWSLQSLCLLSLSFSLSLSFFNNICSLRYTCSLCHFNCFHCYFVLVHYSQGTNCGATAPEVF